MRIVGAALVTLAVLSASNAAHAGQSEVGGGVGSTQSDATITGRFSSGDTIRPRGNAVSDQCYATYMRYDGSLVSFAVDCSDVPSGINFAPLAPAAEQTTAAQATAVVRDYIRTLSMPIPAPTMSAPVGITGARHSVDLRTQSSRTFGVEDTSFGQLRAKAHGTFMVDWGDGTRGNFTTSGAPWPNSGISHAWSTAGTYDIVVTAKWNLDWKLGGYSGVITGLQTTATVPNWSVIEAQAVLRNLG